jgi:hypothetical protein
MITNGRILRQRLLAVAVTIAAVLALPAGGKMFRYDVNDVGDGNDCRATSCDNREDWQCLSNGREVWRVFCGRYWAELWSTHTDDDENTDEPPYTGGGYYDCAGVNNSKDCELKP